MLAEKNEEDCQKLYRLQWDVWYRFKVEEVNEEGRLFRSHAVIRLAKLFGVNELIKGGLFYGCVILKQAMHAVDCVSNGQTKEFTLHFVHKFSCYVISRKQFFFVKKNPVYRFAVGFKQ